MHVFLTGGTGFVGSHLVRALLQRGDRCTVVSRSGRNPWGRGDTRVRLLTADPTRPGPWQQEVSGTDAVINLAGERIVELTRSWSEDRKRTMIGSRVACTRNVVEAIRQAPQRPAALVSGSAIGYYGARGDEPLSEDAAPGHDFLASLTVAWEGAAREAADLVRVSVVRSALIVAPGAPLLAPMLPLFRLGLGGSWGNPGDWCSWIHVVDEVGLMLFLLDRGLEGAFNASAPHPVTVADFATTLASALHRPAPFHAPAFALRLALGERADALLHLQRVVPTRALEAGYTFRFATLRAALSDVFGG